jgi:hypothetical protein
MVIDRKWRWKGKDLFVLCSKRNYLIKIERVLPISNDDQIRKFVYSLKEKVYYNLSDDHLWFSIFSRPLATKFTRVQRCICCFVLLFTGMLLNILYYDQMEQEKNQTGLDGFTLGPFHFTKQQVFFQISITCFI